MRGRVGGPEPPLGRERGLPADPHLGWLVLLGAFLAYALPADPAWHALYGADITAWSVPHLVLIAAFSAIMLAAVALQFGAPPAGPGGPAA